MNVVGKITKPVPTIKEETKDRYNPCKTIQLYDQAPNSEMSLDMFEEYALRRLKVLRKVERVMTQRSEAGDTKAKTALEKLMEDELETLEIDQISHFILRAAYSLDEEKRRWFLNHETALFRYRLDRCEAKDLAKSCKIFQLKPLSAREQQEKIQLLRMMWPTNKGSLDVFYKVPFTQALDLVAKRQCIVEKGYAYIPGSKVISILAGKFRMQLSASLAHLAQNGIFPDSEGSEKERLHPLLKNMNSCLLDSEREEGEGLSSFQSSQVTPANIPKLTKHMPLCMRNMQNGLKQDKKLRYHGRLQYGLFLKGAGFTLEDSMQFFQRAFSNMTPEQFQKEYGYNIRHTYGKEGQKKSKSPYSCSGIINSQAPSNAGDHHGCPYKNFDADRLSKMLQSMKIGTPAERSAIVNLQKSKHYNLACLEHFKAMHPQVESMDIPVDGVGNHPNAWFRASMAYKEKTEGGDGRSAAAASPDNASSADNHAKKDSNEAGPKTEP